MNRTEPERRDSYGKAVAYDYNNHLCMAAADTEIFLM